MENPESYIRAEKDYEKKEKERIEKIECMFQLARDVGSGIDINEGTGEMWFKTWQDAFDFQAHCKENNLPVVILEARPKPVAYGDEYYKVRPE